jgi:hypothetical protein
MRNVNIRVHGERLNRFIAIQFIIRNISSKIESYFVRRARFDDVIIFVVSMINIF